VAGRADGFGVDADDLAELADGPETTIIPKMGIPQK
jgi:hypothetical protein